MTNITKELLENIGGKYWEHGEKRRVYFNNIAELAELDIDYYKTGSIQSASFQGKSLSNNKARAYVVGYGSKLFFDLTENLFKYELINAEVAQAAIAKIKSKIVI